jgi:low affinity Fe/Cu permease
MTSVKRPHRVVLSTKAHSEPTGFQAIAKEASYLVGTKWAFTIAIITILLWLLVGPLFHFSDTWQLVINTATTIITFLMVFLIQNTQNRDALAIQLKLDEIIHALTGARNEMINIEKLSDEELEDLASKYDAIREEYEARKLSKHAGRRARRN